MNSDYEVDLEIRIPIKVKVNASTKEEAKLLAEDAAMEYLESKTKSSREFDSFWEYEAKVEIRSNKLLPNNGAVET